MEEERYFLYIEDDSFNRKNGERAIDIRKLQNVLVPQSGEECQSVINNYSNICGAIIDYRLSNWVMPDFSAPVIIGQKEAVNGIEIAIELVKKIPNIQIGIFSGNEPDLEAQIKAMNLSGNVKIVSLVDLPEHDTYQYITNFIIDTYESFETPIELNVKIKPLHKGELFPPAIETFIHKSTYTHLTKGQDFWRIGKFNWLVSVNSDLDTISDEDLADMEGLTYENPVEEFIIKIDQQDFLLKELQIPSHGIQVRKSDIIKNIKLNDWILPDSSDKYHLMFHLFTARLICDLFLEGTLKANNAIPFLNRLDELAVFESQKILFKEYYRIRRVQKKEEIYEGLNEFTRAGMHKILEVFRGRIDKVKDNIAYVNLKSYSPEEITRTEEFNYLILQEYGLEEDSEFEYSVYQPKMGGYGYHVEPI